MRGRTYYRCVVCQRPVVMSSVRWAHRYDKDGQPCREARKERGIPLNAPLEAEEYEPQQRKSEDVG